MEILIRDAKDVDLKALTKLKGKYAIHRDRLTLSIIGKIRYFVAQRDQKIIGYAVLVLKDLLWEPVQRIPMIIDFYVARAYRNKGIGTAMINHMERIAYKRGIRKLFIAVDPEENSRVYHFYRRLGYYPLQNIPYESSYKFKDSDDNLYKGNLKIIEMEKTLFS